MRSKCRSDLWLRSRSEHRSPSMGRRRPRTAAVAAPMLRGGAHEVERRPYLSDGSGRDRVPSVRPHHGRLLDRSSAESHVRAGATASDTTHRTAERASHLPLRADVTRFAGCGEGIALARPQRLPTHGRRAQRRVVRSTVDSGLVDGPAGHVAEALDAGGHGGGDAVDQSLVEDVGHDRLRSRLVDE